MGDNHKANPDTRNLVSYRYGELPADSAMLEELLKTTEIQQLFESFCSLINIPVAIIDFNANVLFSSRWQRICTQFHRVHPITCGRCIESDTQLATQLQEGKLYTSYTCRNGMTDCAAPIIIEGEHIANVFIGQFLIKAPDDDWFRRQAGEFGFDVDDYLAALHEVPAVEVERVPLIFDLLIRMTRLITNLAVDRKCAIESQTRQTIVFNTIPQGVFWKDIQGRYLGCNASFAKAAGLASPDSIVGKTDFDLPWTREEAEVFRANDLAVISANQPKFHLIEHAQLADGSHIVADTSKIPLVNASNTPYGILGVYEDMAERKRAETALIESELKYRTLFEGADDAILLFAGDSWFDCNQAALRMFGCTREQIIGAHPSKFSPLTQPDGQLSEELSFKIISLAYANKPQAFEWVHCRADGTTFDAEVHLNRLDLGGKPHIQAIIRDVSERKRIDRTLRESEQRFHTLIDKAPIAIGISRSAKTLYVNQKFLDMYGFQKSEELIGQSIGEQWSPEARLRIEERARQRLQGLPVPTVYEDLGQRKDGSVFPVQVCVTLIELPDGLATVGFITDLTERKQAEKALKNSEVRYRSLFNNSGSVMLVVDPADGVIVDANTAASRFYGWSCDELKNMHIAQINTLSPEEVKERMAEALALQDKSFQFQHRRADGSVREVEVSTAPVEVEGRRLIFSIIHDISERKRAEQALKKSEERFQLSMEATSDGLWDWNAETNEVYYSPGCYHMLGYEVGDFPGTLQGWQDLLHPDDIEHTMHVNMDCVEGRCETFAVEYRLKAKNGEWRWILGRGKSIARDAQGRSLRLIGTNVGITERKQMEIALTETQTQILAVMNSTDDMIWSVDPARYGLLTFNQGLKRYFKERLNVDCQIGMTPEELLPAAFAAQWHDIYARALRDGSFVMEYLASSGVNILMLAVNVMKRGNEVFGISVFSKDITESKRVQGRILKLSRLYDTLSQVNTTIVHSTNREDLFRNICKGAVEHGKFLMAWVGLVDEATHRVDPVCHYGTEQGYLADIFVSTDDIPQGRGPTGTSIRENRVCYINNLLTEEQVRPGNESALKLGFQSAVGLPLRLNGKVIGALTMYSSEADLFDAEQLVLMDEMSADISFALDNIAHEAGRKLAEEKIATHVKQLENAMQGTLLAVSNMVELRDPYTSGHERRVGIIAADIAREMGWSNDKCESLKMIGLVHDIGKISVPAEILVKPTRLTEFEYGIMKTHAEKSYEILKDVEFFLPIAEIIRQHHERMDGSGYPQGLKGQEILPEARILAVADVLESMASHRPYRPALGIEAALKELEEHRGTLFDAPIVDAVLKLFREKGYRIPG